MLSEELPVGAGMINGPSFIPRFWIEGFVRHSRKQRCHESPKLDGIVPTVGHHMQYFWMVCIGQEKQKY